MRKILIVGKLNIIMKDVYSYLNDQDSFKVQVCPEQKDIMQDVMEIVEPDMVIISLIGLDEAQSDLFVFLKNKYPYLKVLCYGTIFEQETFKKFFETFYFNILTRPFSNKDLFGKVTELFLEADAEKAAREEEQNARMRKGVSEDKKSNDNMADKVALGEKDNEAKATSDDKNERNTKELERLNLEEEELIESISRMKELEAKLQQVKKEKQVIEGKKKILLVDDNAIQLRTLRSVLVKDYDVLLATSGKDALKVMQKNHPDLVFLDYEMPEMNGKDVMERVVEIETIKDIPVVFLTGEKDKGRIMDVARFNPAGYMLKPPDINKIYDIIGEILG